MKAHRHFTKNQKKKAKLNHKRFEKRHPEACKKGQGAALSKLLDYIARDKNYPPYQLSLISKPFGFRLVS